MRDIVPQSWTSEVKLVQETRKVLENWCPFSLSGNH